MTKRSRIICLVLAAVLTALIEVLTAKVMKYNLFLLITSIFWYFANFVFVIVNIYCAIITKFTRYHSCAAARDSTILGVQLVMYYILGNLQTLKILHLLIAILIGIILFYIAIKISKLMKKICPYLCSG